MILIIFAIVRLADEDHEANAAHHPTVYENIAFTLRMARRDRREIAAKVAEVADVLELGALLHRRPRALSGGQRQRVSIGRAIVRDPAATEYASRQAGDPRYLRTTASNTLPPTTISRT